MDALYSQPQRNTLQSKQWWVACNQTPFLIRFATLNNTILLNITDLKTLWATHLDEKKLMKDKNIYAKTLQVSSVRELIALFEGILTNPEEKALYKFIKKAEGDLTFQVEKEIEVYPFTWKFDLIELDADIVGMLCKDVINPLARTLRAQERRMQIMRKKMEIMERDLLKRMTETEKSYYKSPLVEDEEDLKLLVMEPKEQEYICDLRLDKQSKFFFERSMLGYKHLRSAGQRDKNTKVEKRVAVYNQPSADEILNELEMKKEEQKHKKKKKDFDLI